MHLIKGLSRLRVKEVELPASSSPILGAGIDVMTLPEGHLSCVKCHGHRFECWLYGDNHRLEMGCMKCNENYRLLFPMDVKWPQRHGRFVCQRHPTKAMILIHNIDVVSIGCELCKTEIDIFLDTKTNLITV